MRKLTLLLALLVLHVLLAMATVAAADGPVIWKAHCPRHFAVQTIPDVDGNGVHVLCIRAADAAEAKFILGSTMLEGDYPQTSPQP